MVLRVKESGLGRKLIRDASVMEKDLNEFGVFHGNDVLFHHWTFATR